ncbi:MAG: hypothetical protein ACR2OB_05060 [Solirubrobacteraceae bacterium]
MKVYGPPIKTNAETLRKHEQLAELGDDAEAAAQAWTEAGFDDQTTVRWLDARCFDAGAARALADLGVTPQQATTRTRDGGDGQLDTIAYKVANGALTARQGAARSLSSR